jgi:hypothetical protein
MNNMANYKKGISSQLKQYKKNCTNWIFLTKVLAENFLAAQI